MLTGHRRRNGFTLVEMLVAIAILVILMAMLMPALTSSRKRAMIRTTRTQIQNIYTAIESYKQDVGYYPIPQSNGLIEEGAGALLLSSNDTKLLQHFKYSDSDIESGKYVDAWGTQLRYIFSNATVSNPQWSAKNFRVGDSASAFLTKKSPSIFIYSLGPDTSVEPETNSSIANSVINLYWNGTPSEDYSGATTNKNSDNIWVQTSE